MSVLTVRGIDGDLDRVLRAEAARRGVSLNALIIELVRRGLGVAPAGREPHRELDYLAGTWSDADVAEFTTAVSAFERVDESLWR